jgi:hypothetical protein
VVDGKAAPVVRRAAYALLGTYAATRIFMVFNSGLPQPADMGVALLVVYAVSLGHVRFTMRAFPAYAAFVGWVGFVSTSWALVTGDSQYLIHFVFQVFNFLLFALVYSARVRDPQRLDWWVARGIAFAAFAELAAVLADGRSFRAQGTFNNENQLGYWAVCALGIYTVVRPRPTIRDLPVVGAILWAELASTSRAGVVACLLVLMVWGWQLLTKSGQRYLFGVVGALSLVVVAGTAGVSSVSDTEMYGNFERRFLKDSSTEELGFRNTDRLLKYPEYALLGAGEGGLDRFPHSLSIIEIHSTPATVLFSYGILGTIAYWWFMLSLGHRLAWPQRVALGALILYSTTHNGMRFTYAWFFLALLASAAAVRAIGPLRGSTLKKPRSIRRSRVRVARHSTDAPN